MPLVKNASGEPVGARCINQCGELARLDQRAAFIVPGQAEPQAMTILICPVCQYCEWYYGLEESEAAADLAEAEEEEAEAEAPADDDAARP